MPKEDREETDTLRLVPKALKLIRQDAGLRQTDVSARSGVTNAMVSSYEHGKILPSLPSLAGLLAAMGKDFADLQQAIDEVRGLPRKKRAEDDRWEREVGHVVVGAIREVIARAANEEARRNSP